MRGTGEGSKTEGEPRHGAELPFSSAETSITQDAMARRVRGKAPEESKSQTEGCLRERTRSQGRAGAWRPLPRPCCATPGR